MSEQHDQTPPRIPASAVARLAASLGFVWGGGMLVCFLPLTILAATDGTALWWSQANPNLTWKVVGVVALNLALMTAGGLAFGSLTAIALWFVARRELRAEKPLPLAPLPGEVVHRQGNCTLIAEGRRREGWLWLTPHRLVFRARKGGAQVVFPFDQVESIDNFRRTLIGGGGFRLRTSDWKNPKLLLHPLTLPLWRKSMAELTTSRSHPGTRS